MANGWSITTTGRGNSWLVAYFGDGADVVAHATDCGYRVSFHRRVDKDETQYAIDRTISDPNKWKVERERLGVFNNPEDVVNMLRLLISTEGD
jgi:hypothetical protein